MFRFELFVMKKEVCNAYTELNDPMVQRSRLVIIKAKLFYNLGQSGRIKRVPAVSRELALFIDLGMSELTYRFQTFRDYSF